MLIIHKIDFWFLYIKKDNNQKMSHVQSLQVFHEFAIQNLGEMCGIFALFLLFFYYLLLKSDYSDAFDDNEEEEEDEDEEEEVKDERRKMKTKICMSLMRSRTI